MGTTDDEDWQDVGPDSFTVKSVKNIRRDCIMFLARLFDQINLSPEALESRASFYDLGFQFYLSRIDFSGFDELELGDVGKTLDRISDEDFGYVYPEISRKRIHYPDQTPPVCERDTATADKLTRAARKHIGRGGLDDPDVFRGVQRHNYSRYA